MSSDIEISFSIGKHVCVSHCRMFDSCPFCSLVNCLSNMIEYEERKQKNSHRKRQQRQRWRKKKKKKKWEFFCYVRCCLWRSVNGKNDDEEKMSIEYWSFFFSSSLDRRIFDWMRFFNQGIPMILTNRINIWQERGEKNEKQNRISVFSSSHDRLDNVYEGETRWIYLDLFFNEILLKKNLSGALSMSLIIIEVELSVCCFQILVSIEWNEEEKLINFRCTFVFSIPFCF